MFLFFSEHGILCAGDWLIVQNSRGSIASCHLTLLLSGLIPCTADEFVAQLPVIIRAVQEHKPSLFFITRINV
jgi:hypothetical protein